MAFRQLGEVLADVVGKLERLRQGGADSPAKAVQDFDCSPADGLCPRRADGVSEGSKAVCPVGNPISHSTHTGFSCPYVPESRSCPGIESRPFCEGGSVEFLASCAVGVAHSFTAACRFGEPSPCSPAPVAQEAVGAGQYLTAAGSPFRGSLAMLPLFSESFARGVGHIPCDAEPPIAPMVRAEVGSGYAVPESIIPERGQVSENASKPGTEDAWDVFQEDEAGSKLASESGNLRPEGAASAFNASSLASEREVLTGEAAADGVNGGDASGSKSGSVKVSHVSEDRDFRPVLAQDCLPIGVDLTESGCLEMARGLQAQVKPANAGEQRKGAERLPEKSRDGSVPAPAVMGERAEALGDGGGAHASAPELVAGLSQSLRPAGGAVASTAPGIVEREVSLERVPGSDSGARPAFAAREEASPAVRLVSARSPSARR